MSDPSAPIEFVDSFTFPSGVGWPLMTLSIRVTALADRLGAPIKIWEEDGLGTARGFAARLRSGRYFLTYELDHAIQYLGALGPSIDVDAHDAELLSFDLLEKEVLEAFGLPEASVHDRPNDLEEWARAAGEVVGYRRQRQGQGAS